MSARKNQALGVAEALGVEPVVKRLKARMPWRILPPRLWLAPLRAPGPDGDRLDPPWPDLLITCGKRATAPSAAIRKASGGRTFTVHIQSPPIPVSAFDLVAAPAHDNLHGANVMVTQAAVHRVTKKQLSAAAKTFGPRLAHMPKPRVAVLIGGSNRRHRLTPQISSRVAGQLADLARDRGASLLVTPSRRTGQENEAIFRERLAACQAEIWDGSGANPYFAYLALADAIVVTCDSVSMISEACSTGKPVYVIQLEGSSRRIDAFNARMRADGLTRAFNGELEHWDYRPPDDTARVAAEIKRRMAKR